MSRFSIALIRLATLALLGSAGTAAYAQQTIDQNKALAGNITPGDAPGFPITISVPGSYKLMSNLNVPAGSKGIQITARNVTLDLNGFTVSGPGVCSWSATLTVTCSQAQNFSANGIDIEASATGATVRNGTVRGFAGIGISGQGQGEVVDMVRVTENTGNGIGISNQYGGAVVRNAIAELNGAYGISGAHLIVSTVSQRNGGQGVFGTLAIIQDSYVKLNGGYGVQVLGLKGTVLIGNKQGNVLSGKSLGGNLDGNTPF